MIGRNTRLGLAVLASILGLVLVCLIVREDGRMLAAEVQQQGRNTEIGAELYEQHCRKCHGGRGEGLGQLGPALADQHFFTARKSEVGWLDNLDEYIVATTAHGRLMATRPLYAGNGLTAVMPPWLINNGGPLREDEIRSLAGFVMNWEATALGKLKLKSVDLPPDDLANSQTSSDGQGVFEEHCSSCHSLKGKENLQAAGPPLDGIAGTAGTRLPKVSAADYLRQSVLLPDAFIVEEFSQQAETKPGCGAILPEDQLQALISFLLRQHD